MPRYSLTEIENHCRKATRGTGYHWGEAEEAGKAARWLCSVGIDGATEVLHLLQIIDSRVDKCRPKADLFKGEPQQEICGLSLGYTLSDHGLDMLDGLIVTGQIHNPMITFAILGNSLRDCAVFATTDQGQAMISPELCLIAGDFKEAHSIDFKVIALPEKVKDTEVPEIDHSIWDALNVFVKRTYVPATEESRVKGAG